MTKKIKFITRLLVLTLFSTIISCNDELYDIKNQHNGVDKNKISLAQFKNETAINKIDPVLQIKTSSSLNSKSAIKLSEFFIDTLAIKKLVTLNQKTTYTFRIYPLFKKHNENEYYNLVYRKVNGIWVKTVFLLTKKVTDNKDEIRFETIEKIGIDENVTSKTQKTAQVCFTFQLAASCNGSCTGVCDGLNCDLCTVLVVTVSSCGGASGGAVGVGGASPSSPISYNPDATGSTGGGSNALINADFVFSPNSFANISVNDPNFENNWNEAMVWANLSGPMNAFFKESQERKDFFDQTIQYQSDNNWSPESYEFADWARDYKFGNPDVPWAQFQNWFMTPREGKDGDYDAPFWENPNLTFPQQQLPTFQSFDDAYPRTSGADLALLIGGDVLQLYNKYPSVVRGFCALKVSRGLNYSGITIPYIVTTNKNPGTVLGSDGKYYFLNAKALNKWMQKTFGVSPSNPNHKKILGSQSGKNGENFPFLTAGIKGIYSMVSTNSEWASGHADLINNGTCIFGCHFYDTPPAPIDYIDIWILN
jgi:hypothetical protein